MWEFFCTKTAMLQCRSVTTGTVEASLSTKGGRVTRPPAHSNWYLGNKQCKKKNCKRLLLLKCPWHWPLPKHTFLSTFCAKRATRQLKHVQQKLYKNVNKCKQITFISNQTGLKNYKKAASNHLILPWWQWNMAGKMKQNGIVLFFCMRWHSGSVWIRMDGVLFGGVQGESEVTRCDVTAVRVASGPMLPCTTAQSREELSRGWWCLLFHQGEPRCAEWCDEEHYRQLGHLKKKKLTYNAM